MFLKIVNRLNKAGNDNILVCYLELQLHNLREKRIYIVKIESAGTIFLVSDFISQGKGDQEWQTTKKWI